jgi:hypothetical protein
MRKILIAASALTAVIAAPSAALADSGTPATVIDATRSGIEPVPCLGGLAYVTEENHEVMRWAPDATGALHLTDDVNQWFTLTPVDAGGNPVGETYAGKATIHLAGVLPAGTDPQDATPNSYVFTVRGVAPSGAAITIRQVAHISFDADGTPTVLFDHSTC